MCPPGEVNAACASGTCNRVTHTCATGFLSNCEEPAECVSNVCDDDGKCGYANGHGPCSADTQASVCRSGICNGTGLCIPSGGCAHDSDCEEDRYCRAADFTCALDLVNGSPLPEAHGSCGGSGSYGDAEAGCASGACNATTATCAGPNTETECETAAQCVNNVCGTNHRCGYADGTGSSCTVENAATSCQSGACSANGGSCVPQGNNQCWVDADCAEDSFCHRATFTCTTRLVAGSTLPSDGLHATCSQSGLSRACTTGLCDSGARRCVALNGAACEAAEACLSKVCGGNDMCGYAVGEGPCDEENAAQLCQSGACASSGVCVPAGDDRCWLDTDCDEDSYCDRNERTCRAVVPAGAPIPQDGLHNGCSAGMNAACTTGLCSSDSGLCVAANNASCESGAACKSSVCGSNGKCGRADGEGPCSENDAADSCQSGKCSPQSNVCIGGACWIDSDCPEDRYCDRGQQTCRERVGAGAPVPPGDGLHTGCVDGASTACSTGLCDADSGLCVASNNASCESGEACASGVCGGNNMCGHALGEGPCSADDAADSCQSGTCSPNSEVCITGECWEDRDCADGSYCDREAQACRERIAAGAAVPPGDGLHMGCVDGMSDACSTGLCNADTGLCVASNSAGCIISIACASSICGGNGLCGHDIGEGPCTAENAARVCQSGACASSGVCIPPGEQRCWADTDCTGSRYCSRAERTCRERIAAGSPVVDDGLHMGCSDGMNAACSTGLCSTDSGLCVTSNRASCKTDSACASTICGGNGLCGHADGEGPCSVGSAAGSCQSGKCSPNSKVCVSGDCWADADCGEGSYCDRDAQACRQRIDAGAPAPDDGLHGGCSDGRNVACSTGLCDMDSGRCVASNNAACESGEGCVTGICGGNGLCGRADGEGPCSADDAADSCQSGKCSPSSNVCVTSDCWFDADCGDGSYCDRAEQTCRERIAAGAPLPNDGLHEGCVDGASDACSTGLCNADRGVCVSSNNISCDSGDVCASSICGGNGMCGHADGEGPCSVDNAADSCQSGTCSANAEVCIRGDCWVDKDCARNEFCDRSAQACTKQLKLGAALPGDGLHDSCVNGESEACASGHCEDNRCIEATSAFGVSGGGGCSATGNMQDGSAGMSLLLAALFWISQRRRSQRQ
ncbi:MAG TPA: MYXO-CTERM sorting domain-containing protein [Polyangiales bacterium]|nr:MYXO-CTERM sorting domain-containing protein [Polyangiales bacterium]